MIHSMSDPVSAAKRIAEIDEQKQEIRQKLKDLEEKRKNLESYLLEEMEKHGMQNLQVGGRTVYLHRRITAKPKGGDYWRLAQAFINNGMEEMIRVNANTLAALVREAQNVPDADLPEEIWENIEQDEVYSVRSRKA